MRTVTINIYKYSELPTEAAKERARNWWVDAEMNDPAWLSDHRQSMHAALKAMGTKPVEELIADAEALKFTGYCADAILADVLKANPQAIKTHVCIAYHEAWDKELESRRERTYVEEQIEANEYEFEESGKRTEF